MTAATDLVLIHPPASLPCEPPAGLALLAGRLRACGVRVKVVDANVLALSSLLAGVPQGAGEGAADHRAVGQRERALSLLRSARGFTNRDRHHGAVTTLRRLLRLAAARSASPGRADLADFHDPELSPACTADLLCAARAPERSPYRGTFEDIARDLRASPPRLVGLSVNYLHQALPAMALAGLLRRQLPGLPILAGGALMRCWRGRLAPGGLRPAVDQVVFGDGTAPLLRALGLVSPPSAWPSGPSPDFSDAPWPLYLAPERIAPLTTSQGCFWGRCRYCPEAAQQRPFSLLYPGRLVEALDRVRRATGADLLHLTDSAMPPASLQELAAQVWSGRWYGFARFTPELTRPELCRALRRSGCVMLQLGLESGSPDVLGRLRKGIDLGQASAAMHALADAGIAVYLYVMFGIPGERRDDAQRTLKLVADHASCIRFLNTSLLNLPVAWPAEGGLRLRPFAGANDLTLYTGFAAAGSWDRRDARRFMERELARHGTIATLLRRTPHVFGANHAPFMIS